MKNKIIITIMFAGLSVNIASRADLVEAPLHALTAYADLKASLGDANTDLKIMKSTEKDQVVKAKATLDLMLNMNKPVNDLIIVAQDIAPVLSAVAPDASTKLNAVLKNLKVMMTKVQTGAALLESIVFTAPSANETPEEKALFAPPTAAEVKKADDDLEL